MRYAPSFAAVGCSHFPRPQCFPFPASVAEQRIQPRGVPHTVCAQLRHSRCPHFPRPQRVPFPASVVEQRSPAARRSACGMRSASPQSVSALSASAARSAFPASVTKQRIQPRGVPHAVCAQLRRSRLSPLSASAARSVPRLGGRTANSASRRSAYGMRSASPQSVSPLSASAARSVPRLGGRTAQSGLAAFRMRYAPSFAAVGCSHFPRPQRAPFPASVAEQRIQPRGVPHAVCAQLRRSRCPRFPRPQRAPFPASVAEQHSPASQRSACGMRPASPQSVSALSASAACSVSRLGAGAAASHPCFFARVLFFLTAISTGGSPA